MKKIPIFFTFNDNYIIPAAVAFYSLLSKASTGAFYKMYVLHSDITLNNQKLLLSVIEKHDNASLTFINTKEFLKEEWSSGAFSVGNEQFTVDTVIRCFAAKFFPMYEKIIYSDVDVVFMDDITELWTMNLDNTYIAAVKNAFMKFNQKDELGHLSTQYFNKFKDSYFAGGIWVLNLKKIRQDNLEDKMIEIIKDKTIVKRWNDQDVMNIACDNKVKYLSLRYISYTYLQESLDNFKFVSHYTIEEIKESIEKPKIIHYAGIKPWNGYTKYADIWWEIFSMLHLPNTPMIKKFLSGEFIKNEVEKTKIMEMKYKKYKQITKFMGAIIVILLIFIVHLNGGGKL